MSDDLGGAGGTAGFPCERMPEDAGAARLLGLYPQRQEGLWMQRLKVLGGALSAAQWRTLAEVASEFTPRTPLHLTTRQDVEFHDLCADVVPAVQRRLAEAGLSGAGGCGDTLRNLTVCPHSGTAPGAPDVSGLAWEVRRVLEAEPGILSLPRKFKISLSACSEGCGQPWINDLGLVARRKGGGWGFRVIAGGSLGHKPGTGIEVLDWIEAGAVPPLALGALRLFARLGDRQNRGRARLRHVRERLGDAEFVEALLDGLTKSRSERKWPEVQLAEAAEPMQARVALTFANGDVTPEAADALAELAENEDGAVRIANHHQVMIFGRDPETLDGRVAGYGALAEAQGAKVVVVACPGTRWCSRALADTNALAHRIRRELSGELPERWTVCISGCPNGCAHSAVADIGLFGGLSRRSGGRQEVYRLVAGGGMGHTDRLATERARGLTAEGVVPKLRELTGSVGPDGAK